MAKKGENIFLRKDGRWEARYVKEYKDEKIMYGFVYGKTYREVKRKRNEILLTLKNKINKKKIKSNYFDEVINSWLLEKKLILKESSYSRYYELVNKHIKPYFGKINCCNIDNEIATKFILLKKEENLQTKTIKDILMVLKQIAKYGNININISGPRTKKRAIKILSTKEQNYLESHIKMSFSNDELGVFIALYMGLRIGEICALKWSDIDFNNKIIHINRTISRVKNFNKNQINKTKLIFTEPKTEKSKRRIPIPEAIISLLKIIRNRCSNEQYYVLTNSPNFIEPRSYYNRYKRILKKLELEGFNFHSLRHTFATRCIELGFDPKTLMEILGHSDVKITLAFYVHPTDNLKTECMNKLKLQDFTQSK